MTIDGKPLFLIYRPMQVPDIRQVTSFWRELAVKAGLPGLHLVGVNENPAWRPADYGFDASVSPPAAIEVVWLAAPHQEA